MENKPALRCAAAILLLSISGCATRGGNVPYEPAGFGEPDQVFTQVSRGDDLLVPKDKISISVFNEPKWSGEFQLNAAGAIDYPLIGALVVQGLTTSEVSDLIRTRLGASYVRDPKVQVAITEAAERTITVEGAVTQSGLFPINGPTTLIQAVALARGTTTEANDSRVIVFRTIGGERMAAAFDLEAIRRAEAKDPLIYGNDIVVVPGSKSLIFWREFLRSAPLLGIFRPF